MYCTHAPQPGDLVGNRISKYFEDRKHSKGSVEDVFVQADGSIASVAGRCAHATAIGS